MAGAEPIAVLAVLIHLLWRHDLRACRCRCTRTPS
jgi:hypothetical protein